eukprot:CAMPEP_0114481648 /NCGR_PEP_ID=MMETSP0104-20121206/17801_1 /TAXON_ID=37642 ORGANISM="Paraphysomonas imperforata, Strain PA2" /NCGR_SAMPLE_ID=MMETSP0104 /ASSEMBLY_ACC=CAM_ASM_000202 /LENGTH=172 /DNA_ID=CAMNT_0001657261 /DNA_START=10 /DNA_END=528 /DNA_ORIENTATION=+
MTSMVLSLDIIDVIGDMLSAHYSSLRVDHFRQVLGVLQGSYDHARCFNADDELRALLRAQEETDVKADGKAKSALAEPIIKRISLKIMRRYLLIDTLSLTSTDFFIDEQLAIYAPPVMLALDGIASFSAEQFARNIPWILPLLSDISICNNREVRQCVKQVYENQVNTILIK